MSLDFNQFTPMKVFITLVLSLLFSFPAKACKISSLQPIVSLSGPVTHHLRELGLLNDQNLKAISGLHGIEKHQTKASLVGGGIFLASKTLKSLKGSVVFYDKSRDLKNVLLKGEFQKLIEVDTRGKDPKEVIELVQSHLSPYLSGCQSQKKKANQKILEVYGLVEKLPLNQKPFVFFLGEVKKGKRYPNMIMVNDGPLLTLLQRQKIRTYPSKASYVSWSEKAMKKLKKEEAQLIGLVSEMTMKLDHCEMQKGEGSHYNLRSKIGLSPGWPQLCLLKAFVDHASNQQRSAL